MQVGAPKSTLMTSPPSRDPIGDEGRRATAQMPQTLSRKSERRLSSADQIDFEGYVHLSQKPDLGWDINLDYIDNHLAACSFRYSDIVS